MLDANGLEDAIAVGEALVLYRDHHLCHGLDLAALPTEPRVAGQVFARGRFRRLAFALQRADERLPLVKRFLELVAGLRVEDDTAAD